jgi:hypothetical protein
VISGGSYSSRQPFSDSQRAQLNGPKSPVVPLGYETRTCLQLQLVPGSGSGACSDPGQSNPSGDPVLVTSFNISADVSLTYSGQYSVNTPGARVVVTDVNGTRLGTGNRALPAGQSQGWDPRAFDLTFECVTLGSKRVFPHAPCSCQAVLQTYYSFNCDGVCNVSGCAYNTRGSFNQPPSATAECAAHAADGCAVYYPPGVCQFNSSLMFSQSFWEVSCSFAVLSAPATAILPGGSQQVMCGATYFEVGSTQSALSMP